MKKVLVISYYFPPSGGPGVQRVLKFVKYLPEFGWEPVVLTVKDANFPARDESLLKEIPGNIKVYRTDIFEPYGLYRRLTGREKGTALDVDNIPKEGKKKISEKLAEFIRATFFIPDARKGWFKYAYAEGKKIIEKESPDLIFSSSPPYTCALIAMKLKKYSGIRWVSDFRDAWTGYLTSPNRWFIPSTIDKHCEKSTLKAADVLTIVANGIKDDFGSKYPEISRNKNFVLIRNGFDGEDFKPFDSALGDTVKKFRIVYTGSMYGKRNPYFFIETLSELVKVGSIDRNKLKIIFAGRCAAEIHEFLRTCDIRETIEFIPYLPHSESVQLLLQADAMLLLIDEDKYSKMILSGKMFEYLGACAITGKPILAIAPDGEAADVIRETRAGDVVSYNDKEKLSEVLFKYYDSFLKNIQTFWGNKEAIKKYERKNLTKQLVKVFDEISK